MLNYLSFIHYTSALPLYYTLCHSA